MGANTDIVVVIEPVEARLPIGALELITAAEQLARQCGGRVSAILLGNTALASEVIEHGVDCVHVAPLDDLVNQTVEARLIVLVELCRRLAPGLVLLAHDVVGAELGPRLAFRLDGAVATGCVDIGVADGVIRCTRPCYGGVAREVDRFEIAPLIATIRSGIYAPAARKPGRTGEIVTLNALPQSAPRTRLIARELEAHDGIRLDDASTIVAGGRGLQGPEGFAVLETLAHELGGAVGASRVPCDLGWCPHSWQIGLTGKTVTPDLYFAVGISGAGHHMAGCGNAKTIVAINTDPAAQIFADARFGVLGDYREVVPALVAELRRLKAPT